MSKTTIKLDKNYANNKRFYLNGVLYQPTVRNVRIRRRNYPYMTNVNWFVLLYRDAVDYRMNRNLAPDTDLVQEYSKIVHKESNLHRALRDLITHLFNLSYVEV